MSQKKTSSSKNSTRTPGKTSKRSQQAESGKASSRKSNKSVEKRSKWSLLSPFVLFFLALLLLAALLWLALLNDKVLEKFEGKRWSVPAKVYSRPLELYAGLALTAADLRDELSALHYREKDFSAVLQEGEYALDILDADWVRIKLKTRGFHFSDGVQESQLYEFEFKAGSISASSHPLVRLEPQLIGGIYPQHNEDRILIQLEQTPPLLIETLVMVEDRDFFNHVGVSPKAILRAALVNVFSGGVKQGGSTLTQQLVKNFYLSNERTLTRKVNEALMALLLESHFSKQEILEAYLNEVNLGQMGVRGIHGFGLASEHYFGRNIEDLELHQIALLVALVKGPSYYSPRRNPERALERRNLVLDVMVEHGFITREQGESYKAKTLSLTEQSYLKHKQYPAFLQLVKHQLQADYSAEDLQSEGLRIFTSLDPVLQNKAERSVTETIGRLRNNAAPDLQGAFLAVSPESAEVLALVAGADLRSAGFNRVLNAKRSIGSLVKPAVYLTALRSREYHWASLLDDSEIHVDKRGNYDLPDNAPVSDEVNEIWSPQNFDKEVHGKDGKVPMIEAMSRSYNQATVRLGLDVGLPRVIDTLADLGLQGDIPSYPSVLLGTMELSPLEVTQMYQTIASGGFNTPLKAIREVQDAQGKPLSRYPFELRQLIESDFAYLIHTGLQEVVKAGTARSLKRYLPEDLGLAGKTGTSGDQRDSWFVGYSSNVLATAWVGNDDNSPTPYTGSSAALKIWTHFAINTHLEPDFRGVPEKISWQWIDAYEQAQSHEKCDDAVYVPIFKMQIPEQQSSCGGKATGIRRLFGF